MVRMVTFGQRRSAAISPVDDGLAGAVAHVQDAPARMGRFLAPRAARRPASRSKAMPAVSTRTSCSSGGPSSARMRAACGELAPAPAARMSATQQVGIVVRPAADDAALGITRVRLVRIGIAR